MGRPSTKPKDLRDGYYIDVRNFIETFTANIHKVSWYFVGVA